MTRRKFKFRIEAPWSEIILYLRKLLKFDTTQSLVRKDLYFLFPLEPTPLTL